MNPSLTTTIALTLLSILTSLGVTVHDGRLEQVILRAAGRPSVSTYVESEEQIPKSSNLAAQHVHIDYNPLSQSLSNTFSYQNPSIAPRRNSHHKQLLRLLESGGRHAFDNANLPLLD